MILDYIGLYCEDSWSLGWGHVYVCSFRSRACFSLPDACSVDHVGRVGLGIYRHVLPDPSVHGCQSRTRATQPIAKTIRCQGSW